MAQDTTPAIVVYQGTGSDAPFSIPFDKGYYGEIKVLFVRRGLADYTYYPDTYVVSGRLYAWQNGNTRVFTHTPRPAVGAVIYTDEDVAPVTSITLKDLSDNENIYLRSAEDDVLVRRLYAWKYENTIVYTDTPTPTLSSVVTDYQWHELPLRIVSLTNIVVSAISGQTITVDEVIYTRAVQHDISNNLLLTWTGDTLEVGDFICIIRDTERGQPYEMPINQKHVEFALDNLERQIQELKDATDSALKVDPSYDIEDSHKMNPIQWLETILRSMDKSVRAFRYADGWLDYSLDDPNIAEISKTWQHLLSTENIKNIREASRVLDDKIIYWTEYQDREGNWKPLCKPDEWDSKIDEALEIAQEAKDTADEAKEIAANAQTIAGQAKDIAEDAKETAEGIEDIAQEALDKVTQEITDRETADEDLQDQIDNLSGRGRFLALWNCATGLAESNPPESPYAYKAGDYFVVGTVSSADPAVNYKPDGSSYTTGVASTTVETNEVSVNDTYFYDGSVWKLQSNAQKEVSFSALAGSPYDNTSLSNALNAKQNVFQVETLPTPSVSEDGKIYEYVGETIRTKHEFVTGQQGERTGTLSGYVSDTSTLKTKLASINSELGMDCDRLKFVVVSRTSGYYYDVYACEGETETLYQQNTNATSSYGINIWVVGSSDVGTYIYFDMIFDDEYNYSGNFYKCFKRIIVGEKPSAMYVTITNLDLVNSKIAEANETFGITTAKLKFVLTMTGNNQFTVYAVEEDSTEHLMQADINVSNLSSTFGVQIAQTGNWEVGMYMELEYQYYWNEVLELAHLSDVELKDLEDGQALIYDADTGKWVNGNGGVSATYDETTKTITFA